MKALFQRFHRGIKDKDRDSIQSRDPTPVPKEKFLQLPPLPEWPPPQRATSTPTSIASFKPLPDLSFRPPERQPSLPFSTDPSPPLAPSRFIPPLPPSSAVAPEPISRTASSRTESDPTVPIARKFANGTVNAPTPAPDLHKKVAFISPSPAPLNPDRTLPAAPPSGNGLVVSAPTKTTLSRFQAVHGREPRGSTSAASTSSNDVLSTTKPTLKATSTRAVSPFAQRGNEDNLSIDQSYRSGTPYSQMSNKNSRILAAASWSETAEDDLVSNLGSRERTRQEVLFEILSSEERYVGELFKMKDNFIDPLLHPFAPPAFTTQDPDDFPRMDSPLDSSEYLPPIAARFMSPSPFRSESPVSIPRPLSRKGGENYKDTPNIDAQSLETDEDDECDDHLGKGYASSKTASKHNHPRSPYRSAATRTQDKTTVPFPSRSHHSLPPPNRANPMTSSTQSLGRQSSITERERNYSQSNTMGTDRKSSQTPGSRVLRKFKKSQTTSDYNILPPHELPEDLRLCLEVVDSGVLEGHRKLSEALRKRYEEQYPLVRSLADVFVSNADIFHGYAAYVLHLERALEQVDEALSNVDNKKRPKKQDAQEWARVCRYLQHVEEVACSKGETGLAITLSKPFQRLLKYPLLFQNLLYHTDPSTFEYETTLQMVAEVETIVRSIEDEKIQKEERDKTRDVFARIEGLEKVKQLALPKPSRVLIEERPYMPGPNNQDGLQKNGSTPPVAGSKVKGKSSFKRLSDVLHSGAGGKKDLWLVVFNDVALQCQRTGTTSLPLVAATNSRTNSLPELQGKTKYATTGRRSAHTKPRNLYKFIKIETWAIGGVVQPRVGVVSMEEVVRSRAQVHSSGQPRVVPLPDENEDGEADSDDSDRKSKMSFSYWGADKITIQKPHDKLRSVPGARRSPTGPLSYSRESSANAKFGTRLVSGDNTSPAARAAARKMQITPLARRAHTSDDVHATTVKATVTRPAWDTSTRTPYSSTPAPSKRSRNTSQNSAATRVATTAKALASPAPSEDSGVGLYRQMLEQNPSLTRV